MRTFAKHTILVKLGIADLPTCSLTGIRNFGVAYPPLPNAPIFKIEIWIVPKGFGES
jgi:hypothetical protein